MNKKERDFISTVRTYHKKEGRHGLPWRKTVDPYKILVSEVMLQQTQVERVVPKYRSFLKTFPTIRALASAPLGAVLREWQGLGYNRRAKMLHECAKRVVGVYGGALPAAYEELRQLPGIGPYTAGAVCAFAHGTAVPVVETNIRTAYLHHFFRGKNDVADRDILRVVERTLDREHPKEWYAALMDYGAHLKGVVRSTNTQSRHYVRQSRFDGSDRQVRGAIVRVLGEQGTCTVGQLTKTLSFDRERIAAQLTRLKKEGMVEHYGRQWSLPRV